MLFWVKLACGRENSISTCNIYEAQRRARALQAVKLYCKNLGTGDVAEIGIPV